MNQRKKKRKKELGKGERKKNERKGHEWQLIWGVSATPQRAMTSSGIEVREKEKGFFKKLAAYRGRNYICAKHAQVLLCFRGNHFQGWGLEGWINQLCLLWGLFITKIFLTTWLCSKNTMYPMFPVPWSEFLKSAFVFWTCCSCHLWVQNHPENSNCPDVRINKKNVLPTRTPPLPTPPTLSLSIALGAYKAFAVHGG